MKHIQGIPVTSRAFRDALVEGVAAHGVASAAQMVEVLGVTDQKEKHALSVMMVDLTKRKVFVREGRGQYRIHPTYEIRKSRSTEETIAAVIAQYGGLATTSEVLKAFEALPSENSHMRFEGRGNSKEQGIRRELKNSAAVRNISIKANATYWTLNDDRLLQIPLSGRAVEVLAKFQYQNATVSRRGGPQAEEDLHEDIETHFIRVGRALRRVRRLSGYGLDDIAAMPGIDETIEWARWRSPELSREVRIEMKGCAKERADEEGVEIGSARYEAILDEEELRYGALALDLLESGSEAAHRAMPVAIYYIYAERFDLCPASLSRGLVHSRVLAENHKLLSARWGWLP